MKTKQISFHVIDVQEGQILFRCTKNVWEVWTCCDETNSYMVFNFGLPMYQKDRDCMTYDAIMEFVTMLYHDGQLFFAKD